jgi:hypothetical protein
MKDKKKIRNYSFSPLIIPSRLSPSHVHIFHYVSLISLFLTITSISLPLSLHSLYPSLSSISHLSFFFLHLSYIFLPFSLSHLAVSFVFLFHLSTMLFVILYLYVVLFLSLSHIYVMLYFSHEPSLSLYLYALCNWLSLFHLLFHTLIVHAIMLNNASISINIFQFDILSVNINYNHFLITYNSVLIFSRTLFNMT